MKLLRNASLTTRKVVPWKACHLHTYNSSCEIRCFDISWSIVWQLEQSAGLGQFGQFGHFKNNFVWKVSSGGTFYVLISFFKNKISPYKSFLSVVFHKIFSSILFSKRFQQGKICRDWNAYFDIEILSLGFIGQDFLCFQTKAAAQTPSSSKRFWNWFSCSIIQ